MRKHLRCNLLFGLIGHFGLLKDVNISFFLCERLSCGLKSINMKYIFLRCEGCQVVEIGRRRSIKLVLSCVTWNVSPSCVTWNDVKESA